MQRLIMLLMTIGVSVGLRAQFKVDQLIVNGQVALHYEEYLLSIQYFNQAIALKPYLYEPWQYRAAAKYYLDDYVGAENDATEAIMLNPYIDALYDLRAIVRVYTKDYTGALSDYSKAYKLSPDNKNYLFNQALCLYDLKDYDKALSYADSVQKIWENNANVYSFKAQLFLQKNDTIQAAHWLDESLLRDSFQTDAWTTRAYISLSKREWKDANEFLSRAIHLAPKSVNNYVNRALARINLNNLRGAMSDYDIALDIDPRNFLAHYNRGLLRMQLGDDNRAIHDFDFVINMEPQNTMAILNRAILNEKTGNFKQAIKDYTAVLDAFPNFWQGLAARARCYRIVGQTAKAELDEFKIFKAQIDKRLGFQQRWSRDKIKRMRKRSEINLEKYNQLVVEDQPEVVHVYKNPYRGKIQNKKVEQELLPLYQLSLHRYHNGLATYTAYDSEVEQFNSRHYTDSMLYVACLHGHIVEAQSFYSFDCIEKLADLLSKNSDMAAYRMLRGVVCSELQNFDAAYVDLSAALKNDTISFLAFWQRGVCSYQMAGYLFSKGQSDKEKLNSALADFQQALHLHPRNTYLNYNIGNVYYLLGNLDLAVEFYNTAIKCDDRLAEAYYNRGIVRIKQGKVELAKQDFSKAGELGIYQAYGLMKTFSKKK